MIDPRVVPFRLALAFGCSVAAGCQAPSDDARSPSVEAGTTTDTDTSPADPKLRTVDGVAVVPIQVDGFNALSIKQKQILLHHSRALRAAESIHYALLDPQGLRVHRLLQQLMVLRKEMPGTIMPKLTRYAERFWMHRGNRDQRTGEMIRPTFIPGELGAAAQIALNKGVDLGLADLEEAELGANQLQRLETLVRVLQPFLFARLPTDPPADAGSEPDGGGVEGGDEHHESLHTRFARSIAETTAALRAPLKLMDEADRPGVEQLITYLSSGDSEALATYQTYVAQTLPTIQTTLRLIDAEDGSDGTPASIRGLLVLRNDQETKLLQEAASRLQAFERRMPWHKRYHKEHAGSPRPAFGAYAVVAQVGPGAPVSLINLDHPDGQSGIERHGDQVLLLRNIDRTLQTLRGDVVDRAFSIDPAAVARNAKWRDRVAFGLFVLREVIGRRLGKPSARRRGLPPDYLSNALPALEEARADAIALYLAFEPLTHTIGLIPHQPAAQAGCDRYFNRLLEKLALSRQQNGPGAAHHRARGDRIVLKWAVEKGGVEVVEKDGHVFFTVKDYSTLRKGMGELAAAVQRIRFSADHQEANRLVNTYGAPLSASWHEDARNRWKGLPLPSAAAIVLPVLRAKLDDRGQLVDVTVHYPSRFIDHQAQSAQ